MMTIAARMMRIARIMRSLTTQPPGGAKLAIPATIRAMVRTKMIVPTTIIRAFASHASRLPTGQV